VATTLVGLENKAEFAIVHRNSWPGLRLFIGAGYILLMACQVRQALGIKAEFAIVHRNSWPGLRLFIRAGCGFAIVHRNSPPGLRLFIKAQIKIVC
jgi:hypothetical protein